MDVVLVVTSIERLLDPIVDRLAAAGFTAYSALPSAARELQRSTSFDRVVWHAESAAAEEQPAANQKALTAMVQCPMPEPALDPAMTDLLVRMATAAIVDS